MQLVLGTVQFGMDYGVQGSKQPSQAAVNEMLLLALENGIGLFDTAMAYGEAESVLGRFRNAFPEQGKKMRFVSKLKAKAFENEPKEKWPEIAVKNAEESLQRIGADELEAYLFHNAALLFEPGAVEALHAVEEKKQAKMIGVATYTPEEAMKALEFSEIKAIQIPYNVFDQRLDRCGFFERARERGIRLYARSSLLQGLALMDPNTLPGNMSFAKNYLLKFREICERWEMSPLSVAIRYSASNNDIDSIVFGVDTIDQLKEYLSIPLDPLPEVMLEELKEAFTDAEEKLVNPTKW